MNQPGALELSETEVRHLVEAVVERITTLYAELPHRPADTSPAADPAAIRSLIEPLPTEPSKLDDLLDLIFDRATAAGLNPISPGFMGYVPGGGLFHAAVADLIADTINQYVAVSAVAPVLNQLETNVIRWLCQIIGYPESARGFLTSGGSMATLSAITTARDIHLGEKFSDGVIYVSDQVHHCVTKAAVLSGFPRSMIRILPADKAFRLKPEAVEEAIRRDRRRGLRPFMIVASAGTVNTGTVDALPSLAALARREGLWLHVDAAYGGLFRLTDRGKEILRGIDEADSVVVDPHKTLFLPYGTGCLMVREGRHLHRTHGSSADYLPALQASDADAWDFCEISPELTRPFRGLRVWLPMKLYGAGVFRDYLDEKLDLARWVEGRIREIPELEILAPAELSILAFAAVCHGCPIEERNERTRRLIKLINEKNRVHLTGTVLDGLFAIRIAVVAYRTHRDRMEMLLEDLTTSLAEL